MNIWPFRKSTLIYNWDANYTPIIASAIDLYPDLALKFVCPPDYYAKIQRILYQITRNAGIGGFSLYTQLWRGSQLLANYLPPTNNQPASGSTYSLDPDFIQVSPAATVYTMLPFQRDLHLIPGDMFYLYYSTTYVNLRFSLLDIVLHAYYF